MKVRMVSLAAGPDGSWPPGSVHDLPEGLARALVAGGYAVAVDVAGSGGGPRLAGVEHAIDARVVAAERRTDWGEALITDIDGIGPVIAQRLGDGGIETMAELLAADPAEVALLASVKPVQVEKWRQRAAAVVGGS